MARKTKEILLARGYTEADLAGITLLSDPKFCAAIEAEAAEADEHKAKVEETQQLLDSDTEWYRTKAVPALNKAVKDATDARAKAAELEARLKSEQEYGLRKIAEQEGGTPAAPATPATPATPAIDPSQYVTAELFNQTASQFGSAIAMATDITEDHRELFGKRMEGGISKLRAEYMEATQNNRFRGDLRQYWETKFKVPEKREELRQAEVKKREDTIRAEERSKVLSEVGNPMTRTMVSSRNPFTNRGTAATSATTGTTVPVKQPWERPESERSSARVSKFASKLTQQSA
jgi:hypothetical protein